MVISLEWSKPMAAPTIAPLERRIGQARRRLAVQTLLNRLIGCWAIALAIALGWFLVQPFAYPAASEGLS